MKNHKDKIIKCISIAALLFVCALNTTAQDIELGVRYMPTISSFQLRTSAGNTVIGSSNFGFGCGALLGINLTNNLGIQGEIIYNSISQKYTEMDVENNVNLRYINIPLLLSLNTDKSKPINLNLVAGPQIGLSVGSSLTTTGGNGTEEQAILEVKKSDFGLAYGAGIDFGLNPANTARLGIGFRGVLGLIDISDNSNTIATNSYYILDRSQIKTYSLYIGFSFLF